MYSSKHACILRSNSLGPSTVYEGGAANGCIQTKSLAFQVSELCLLLRYERMYVAISVEWVVF